MEVALVRVTQDGRSQRVVLSKEQTVLGRQDTCQIRIPTPGISRKHCEVVVSNGSITVNDLGSSNGTFLNQERISSQPAAPGDLLSIGGLVFLIQVNGDPEDFVPEFLFEEGLPEGAVNTASATGSPKVPAPKPAGGLMDESSMMDFEFDDSDDEEQPPL